jgi:glutamyl-tRNA synthetase
MVRVRIAPSPTGKLHIGTARAALFNWLFAKKNEGKFIVRIEDTDLERSSPEFEKDILDNLKWLGIYWDEGPDIGGEFGPYRQSERGDIYAKYIKQLIDEGKAYHCFCTEEELLSERQEMLSRGIAPKYSGKCRNIELKEALRRKERGEKSIIRFIMPNQKITINDLIRGKITFDTSLIGDIAIAKDINIPLYNFAVVIDDFEMQITHVLRGEDHISNTPKQVMIAKALGIKTPIYGHFPLILGPDRTKLSKRHGATAISEYRKLGYLSEALVNFMALLGWHPKEDREIFSKEELINEFSIERIQKGGAIFNISKLEWLNSYYIKQKSDQELFELLKPYWEEAGLYKESRGVDFYKKISKLYKERIKKLSDIVSESYFFFERPIFEKELLIWKNSNIEETKYYINEAIAILEKIPEHLFNKEILDKNLNILYGNDKGKILWPMRVALSGKKASPGPFDIAEILGKEETLYRLRYALSLL